MFWQTEQWDFFTAFYFCFVGFTTIGYGDFSPQSPAGRAFCKHHFFPLSRQLTSQLSFGPWVEARRAYRVLTG